MPRERSKRRKPNRKGRTGATHPAPQQPARPGTIHENLLLLHTADGARLDTLLSRVAAREHLLLRPEADRALFGSYGLSALTARLNTTKTPFVFEDPTRLGAVAGTAADGGDKDPSP